LLSSQEIDCIGHRIVHSGKKYEESVPIDANVKKEIRNLADLAPLHNLAALERIEILEKLFSDKPQITVFDTAFHHTLPEAARIYPVPCEWFKMGIQRFGFRRTSFQYCSKRAAELLGKEPHRMVICHLGSGASLCAAKNGKSVDTTMGLTPLEGLMMDKRSGSIDPGLLLYLLQKKGKTVEELSGELYEKSGLLGLSGISSNMRDVMKKASEGDNRAQLAIDVYVHRLTSMVGSMVASLEGIDVLIFTSGIGENASLISEEVCQCLLFLGIHVSSHHQSTSVDSAISSPDSKIEVLVIHTQKAFEIAREC